jgi:hypothetical protein
MPFNTQQFLDVFAAYNSTVFPAQVFLIIAALVAIRLAGNGNRRASKIAAVVLSLLWLWMGAIYHWVFFSPINAAAWVFGAFFIFQSAIFFHSGVLKDHLTFKGKAGARSTIGTILVIYSLVIYPVTAMAAGHSYPYTPTFGLPCPTTIFTFGLLLRAGRTVPLYILPIPFLWSLVGFSATYDLGVREDLALVLAGSVGTGLLVGLSLQRKYHLSHGLNLKEN